MATPAPRTKRRTTKKPTVRDVVAAVRAGAYDLIELDELYSAVRQARLPQLRAKLDSADYPPPRGYYDESVSIDDLRSIIQEELVASFFGGGRR